MRTIFKMILALVLSFSFASAIDFKKGNYINYVIPPEIRAEAGLSDGFPKQIKIEFEFNADDSPIADWYTVFTQTVGNYWFILAVDQIDNQIVCYHLTITRLSDNETIYGKDGFAKLPVSHIAGYIHH